MKTKWRRFKYLPVAPLGKDGRLVTGSPKHIRLSRTAAAEGMVLLKNENHLLPLRKGGRVALFGKASADYRSRPDRRPDFKLFLPAVRGCKAPRILSPGAAPSAREHTLCV